MTHVAHEDIIRDYIGSAPYEKAFKDRELIAAVLHVRHFKEKASRKTWLARAREADKAAAARLTSGAKEDPRGRGATITFVGPELAGKGLSVPDSVSSMAQDLAGAGCRVELVTRLLPGTLPPVLREAVSDVRFVRPLQPYCNVIGKEPGLVVTFWLPLSVSLCGDHVSHICFWDAGGTEIADGDGLAGQDAALISHLAPMPDVVFGNSKLPSCGRRAFPADARSLASLAGAKIPPQPDIARIPSISACMIAKDEEGTIDGCFQSLVPCADQVVVNDTGSKDRTVEVAEAYGAEVMRTDWKDDFSLARNDSMKPARLDYVLIIDADERVAAGSELLLREAPISGHDAYILNVASKLEISTKSVPVVRLLKNLPHHTFTSAIHEQIAPSVKGKIGPTVIVLDHLGYGAAISALKFKRGRNVSLLLKEQQNLGSFEDPAYAYLAFQTGVEMLLSGNMVDALSLLSEAVEKATTQMAFRPSAALRLCQTLVLMGRVGDAESYARQLLAEYPGFLDVAEVAATALLERGEFGRAGELLDEAVKAEPGPFLPKTEGADTFMLSSLKARALYGLGDAASSYHFIQKALSHNPDYPDAQRVLAMNWPDRTPDCLRKAGAKTARPAALALLALGNADGARKSAEAVGDYGALGEICLRKEDYAGARECFAKSSDSWDRDRAAILKRCEAPKGSYGGALSESLIVGKVLDGKPVATGEADQAVRILGFLLDLKRTDMFVSSVTCLDRFPTKEILAGKLLHDRGFLDLANEYLERRQSDTPECLSMLGDISFQGKRYADAERYYSELSKSRHLNPVEAFRLANCLLRAGDVKAVAETVSAARQLYPEDEPLQEFSKVLQKSRLFKDFSLQ